MPEAATKPTPSAIVPGKTGNKISVVLKHPHGLILRVFDMVDGHEPLPGGGTKTVQRAQPRADKVFIRGYLDKYDPAMPPLSIGSRFAVTHNVDKDFFELWLKQNHDHDAVVNGILYASESPEDAAASIREKEKDFTSGLEPLDPTKLVGKRVETEESQRARLGLPKSSGV